MPIVGLDPCCRQFNLTWSNWLGSLFSHPACFNGPPIFLNWLLAVMLFSFYFAIYSWWYIPNLSPPSMQAFVFGFRLTASHGIAAYCIIGSPIWKQVIENSWKIWNILLLVCALIFNPSTSINVFKVVKQSTCAPLCLLLAGSCTQAVDSWKGTRTR